MLSHLSSSSWEWEKQRVPDCSPQKTTPKLRSILRNPGFLLGGCWSLPAKRWSRNWLAECHTWSAPSLGTCQPATSGLFLKRRAHLLLNGSWRALQFPSYQLVPSLLFLLAYSCTWPLLLMFHRSALIPPVTLLSLNKQVRAHSFT